MKDLAVVERERSAATLPSEEIEERPLKPVAGYPCMCGTGMVWLEGHAVCEACKEYGPSCVCNGEPVRLRGPRS